MRGKATGRGIGALAVEVCAMGFSCMAGVVAGLDVETGAAGSNAVSGVELRMAAGCASAGT